MSFGVANLCRSWSSRSSNILDAHRWLQFCPHYLCLERSVVAQEAGRALTLPGLSSQGLPPLIPE